MKTTRFKIWTVLTLALASGWFAAAQSTNVPGPNDYNRFVSFITQRNIFDPNRYAVTGPRTRFTPRRPAYAPTFTLVGTMSYGKGMFAFFDGNQPELRKVLYSSESNVIAGYVLTGITATNVTLQSADKKQTLWMKIGDSMRQEGNEWITSGQGQVAGTGVEASPASSADSSSTEAGSASAPSSTLQGNDVLKKLMQQRQQELK